MVKRVEDLVDMVLGDDIPKLQAVSDIYVKWLMDDRLEGQVVGYLREGNTKMTYPLYVPTEGINNLPKQKTIRDEVYKEFPSMTDVAMTTHNIHQVFLGHGSNLALMSVYKAFEKLGYKYPNVSRISQLLFEDDPVVLTLEWNLI